MRAGVVFQRFSHCSTTANPSLTDDGFKKKFSSTTAWLRAGLKGNRFKIPHFTCTNRYGVLGTIYKHRLQSYRNIVYTF